MPLKIGQVKRYKVHAIEDEKYIVHDLKNNQFSLYKRFTYKQKFVRNQFIFLHVFEDRDHKSYLSVKLPILEANEVGMLKVLSVDEKGFFLDNGFERDVFLPIEEKRVFLEINDTALVKIFYETKILQRATMKFDFKQANKRQIKLGRKIKARMINKIKTKDNHLTGIRLLTEDCIAVYINKENIERIPRINMIVDVRITEYRKDGYLNASMLEDSKQRRIDDKDFILNYIHANNGVISITDRSSPERIKEILGISKKAFKKAIAILLSSKKILMKDNKYYLR